MNLIDFDGISVTSLQFTLMIKINIRKNSREKINKQFKYTFNKQKFPEVLQ